MIKKTLASILCFVITFPTLCLSGFASVPYDYGATEKFVLTSGTQEYLQDPMDMSDEDFFGVYDKESATWTNKGVFDYDCVNELANMSAVKSAVMDGNYKCAKEEFLAYMKKRKPGYVKTKTRNTLVADAACSDFVSKSTLLSEAYVGSEWETVEANIPVSALNIETPLSLDLVAFYNEESMAEIKARESGKSPILRLTVNGTEKDFEATDDGYIRLGSYSDKNFGKEEKMYVKLQGADLGDETYRSKIKFDISSLGTLSGVTSAKLVFEGKASPLNNEKKRILIIKSYSALWKEDTLNFKSHVYDYRSFNGQPNGIDWVTFSNADVEYMYQICRFPWLTSLVCEYEVTGNEIYAKQAIRQLMDFICDHGADGNYTGSGPIGQYPRSLDTTERLVQILACIDSLCESEYMNPDSCTAIMKHVWHMAEASRLNHAQSGNWAQTIMIGLLNVSNAFPEFAAANGTNASPVNWKYYAQSFNIKLMEDNYYEDGTYIEPTGGYSVGAHSSYIGTYGAMKNDGYSISDDAYKKLYNGTYYNLLSFAPGGMTYAYGDSGYSKGSGARQYPSADAIFNDPELTYIDSFGALGKRPSWTSKNFPVGKYTFMRSDWSKSALYMATQVRGYEYGSHGHADRNHVTVAAFGKLLLTDAGSFTYTSGPLRELGRSTKMHNTVSVNDKTQTYNENSSPEAIEKYGKIHQWKTSSNYDFLVQSTDATEGFNHKRTIFFAKPYYWIVSDFVDANDNSTKNEYRQNWHMMPTAKMTVDAESNVMYSNNDDNINITVASADSDAKAMEEKEGYWAQSIGSVTDNPYGYFSKSQSGDVTFDTALVPTKTADSRVEVERLSTGTDEKISTAMKITVSEDGAEECGYYYLSYEDEASSVRIFDAFSTDGLMAFVHEDSDKNPDMIVMQDAKFVKKNNRVILESEKPLSDLSINVTDGRMYISSSEDVSLSDLKIYCADDVKMVYMNDSRVKFSVIDDYVTSIGDGDSFSGSVGDLFKPTQIIYVPDYEALLSDPTDDGRIEGTRNPPALASDGSLKLESVSSGQCVWRFYFNQNKTNLPNGDGNVYCIDFDIKKPNTETASYIQIGDSGDKMYRAYIHGNSAITADNFTNIKFIVDTSSSTKKLIYLVDNQYATVANVGRNLQNFLLCTNASSYSYYIDDFSVYKISKEDFDTAEKFFTLTEDDLLGANVSADHITEKLNLSDSFEWTSSNENLISPKGEYVGATVWQSEKVTLTARYKNIKSKDFTFTVMRKALPKPGDMTGDYYVYDDFETSTLETNGVVTSSGKVEIKNGKLYHTHTGSSGETVINYWFTPQKSPASAIAGGNVMVVEFDVKKELTESLVRSAYYIRIQSYDGWRHYAQTNVKESSSQPVGASGKAYYDSTTAHFKYVLDTENKTYSLYVNGVLEYYETPKNTVSNPYNHIQALTLVNQTPGSTVSLDNIKVYSIDEKSYKTGYSCYGITNGGVLKDQVNSGGVYEANISYFEKGLPKAPDEKNLPVCYVAKYNGDALVSVKSFPAKLVTYSETDGAYGWWYPEASVGVQANEVGNTRVKAFVWNTITPASKAVVAGDVNK